jgi:hypothetical protein
MIKDLGSPLQISTKMSTIITLQTMYAVDYDLWEYISRNITRPMLSTNWRRAL